ncbi:signal recognition particle subunit FFH/SRP54 (srp54) [Desulforamulus reducens MI-1]|uniref:Signal recognition particle protein n=1 Tax=Desulforamulus reducens (strain ATCC BAA-1160 / DSM 100696 / MI-1) TaxID=349161 RepID=A4J670_DESRM|nr:signal recognition particle protein [Desulforamulus reducens]ABO50573.1 signal recognition particle subunit FFH/SRP54 (srp54) [Desulforamulus reducens MI-1]
MFKGLGERLDEIFKSLKGKGRLTEDDVNHAMREVKMALLEADVNFKVVKEFVAQVKGRAVGQDVLESLSPAQQVIKIVRDELTELLGGTQAKINLSPKPPTIIMLVGLQGAGKTTTAGKLAKLLSKQGRRPLMVAGDIYRPAAIKQLQVLGDQLNIPVFSMGQENPVKIAQSAVEQANSTGRDLVIIDTAGRLHINEELMDELANIKSTVRPHEILLVVDAMTGQEAVNVADTFNQKLGLDGIVMTKLDGDARGGAALSVRKVTGTPIKFAGMGEKLDALEPFYPDRMADRILGMGDVLTLIEKAQANFDAEQAAKLNKKIRQADFNLEDFLEQMQQVKKLGPLEQVLGMIPGMGKLTKQLKDQQLDGKELAQVEAIIYSMTVWERHHPEKIDGSRKKRIARGSGTRVQDVNQLLKQFEQTRKMMKQISNMTKGGKKGKMKLPFFQ